MKLPRFIASGGVRETGLVRAQDIGALTNVGDAEFRAIAQAGAAIGAVSDLGFRAFMSRQAIDDEIESGKATQRVQESWNNVDNTITNLVPDIDMPLPGDPDYNKTLVTLSKAKIDKMLPELLGDVEKDAKEIFGSVVNPKLKAQLIAQYNDQYADNVKRVKGALNAKLNDYQLGEINKLATAAARNGNADIANHYIDIADKHGLITHTKAVALKDDFTKLAKKSITDSLTDAVYAAINTEDFGLARVIAESPHIDARDQHLLQNTITAAERKVDDEQVEVQKDILGKKLAAGTLTYPEIDAMDALDEDTQESYRLKMLAESNRRGKGEEILVNQKARSELDSMATNIWRDTLTLPQFTEALDGARFGVKVDGELQYVLGDIVSDKPLIDDAEYEQLSTQADTELAKAHAQSLASIKPFATTQLVFASEDDAFQDYLKLIRSEVKGEAEKDRVQVNAIEQRQLQFWNLRQYMTHVRGVLEKTPDMSGKEFRQESEAVLYEFKNRTIEEIKQLEKRQAGQVLTPPPLSEAELKGGMTDAVAAETLRIRTEGETVAADFLAKHPLAVQMQGPTGVPIRASLATIGSRLDRGDVFPPGSNIRVKRNPSDKTITFEGLSIEPGKRVISFDGGATWQLLP